MVIVISNKLKDVVESSKLGGTDYKYAHGLYSSDDCIRTLSTFTIDYLIIDITALKDAFQIAAWKKFRDFFDPNKTIILLEQTKSYSNVEFLSMLITMGFYNFTKTSEGLVRLLEHPNTYQDVSKYQKMAISLEERKEVVEEEISEYQRKLEETQEMMKDYLDKYQKGEAETKKKPNILKKQIKTSIILILLTFLGVFIIYSLQIIVSNFVPPVNDYVGEYLYGELWNTGFTPLTIIGIMIVMGIFSIYYSFLNARIKNKQMTRGKFIIIPFAIYCVIIFGEYYLVGAFEKIYNVMMFISISDKPYLCQDLYGLSRWVATAVIFLFYAEILVSNSKTLKFERDLSQNLTMIEKFWVLDMILLLVVPLFYQVSKAFEETAYVYIYNFASALYDQPLVILIIAGLEVFLTVLILLQPKFSKEKEYTILKEEDL